MAHADRRPPGARLALRGTGLASLDGCDVPHDVEELDLRDNGLASADELQGRASLRTLLLGRNALTSTAGWLASLHGLRVLDLSDNRLARVQLRGLGSLQALNLAGNRLRAATDLDGLAGCTSLTALDLARNELADSSALLRQLAPLPLRLLSLLGNPSSLGDPPPQLPRLAVWRGRVLPGGQAEAARLRVALPARSGVLWAQPPGFASSSPDTAAPSSSSPDSVEGAPPSPGAARRQAPPIMDSADDMASGESRDGSVAGGGGGGGGGPSPALPDLVQRQDSAHYEPRPPALAERQDSAQNLQALAQAEAERMRAGSPTQLLQPGLTRQDSANELGGAGRAASPARRLQHEGDSAAGSLPAVSPHHDSASERAGLARLPAQPQAIPGGAPERLLGRGGSLDSPSQSLEAARQLHAAAAAQQGGSPRAWAGPAFLADASPLTPAPRQDSALDSLAEARRAVLAELPASRSVPLPTAPLRQARQLLMSSSGKLPGGAGGWAGAEEHGPLPPPRLGSPRGTVLRIDDSLAAAAAEGSPFDRPVTPLSPAWTLQQRSSSVSSARPQELPRVESGVPWQPSAGSAEQLAAGMHELLAGRSGLSDEAGEGASGSTPAAAPGSPGGGPDAGLRLLPGRNGEPVRETPYPDSPLAAGERGSRDSPAFFRRQASLRAPPGGESPRAERTGGQ